MAYPDAKRNQNALRNLCNLRFSHQIPFHLNENFPQNVKKKVKINLSNPGKIIFTKIFINFFSFYYNLKINLKLYRIYFYLLSFLFLLKHLERRYLLISAIKKITLAA